MLSSSQHSPTEPLLKMSPAITTSSGCNPLTSSTIFAICRVPTNNLTFLSALKLLEQLVERELLTTEEAEVTHRELARRLRPTLILG